MGDVFTNSHSLSTGMILVADMHRIQQTDEVIELPRQRKTIMVSIPAVYTSRIQSRDVCTNKPFKDAAREEHEKHQQENLNLYTKNKMSTSERRIVITKLLRMPGRRCAPTKIWLSAPSRSVAYL